MTRVAGGAVVVQCRRGAEGRRQPPRGSRLSLAMLVAAACVWALGGCGGGLRGLAWAGSSVTRSASGWLWPTSRSRAGGRAGHASLAAGSGPLPSSETGEDELEDLSAYEVAQQIASETRDSASQQLERSLLKEAKLREERVKAGAVMPSSDVYDFESLLDKHGGVEEIARNHKAAVEMDMYAPSLYRELEEWLETVQTHKDDADQSFVEFESAGGSRLVVVGTLHISRSSREFARSVVRREKPECLVLEIKLGDDSLQELTIPTDVYQDLTMSKSPVDLAENDDELERAWKFQEDKAWISGTLPFRSIGGHAAWGQEFGAAFQEFAEQRRVKDSGGPRGGTVCFADIDLRVISRDEQYRQGGMLPDYGELAWDITLPMRDLTLARSLRAALRTHKTSVAVVGKYHLFGIKKLLQQDPTIKVVKEGAPPKQEYWHEWFTDGGKEFEKQALRGYSRWWAVLASDDGIDEAPLGTWMSSDAAVEMLEMRAKTEALMRAAKNIEEVEPAGPWSSDIAKDFWGRHLMATPGTFQDLQRWLKGERIPNALSDAADFPYESRWFKARDPNWKNPFPKVSKDRQKPKFQRPQTPGR